MRLARRGWKVPCMICQHVSGEWFAIVDGLAHDSDPDPATAPWVADVWANGEFITAREYEWLRNVRTWAEQHHPEHPALHPLRPIDPMTTQPRYPERITPDDDE